MPQWSTSNEYHIFTNYEKLFQNHQVHLLIKSSAYECMFLLSQHLKASQGKIGPCPGITWCLCNNNLKKEGRPDSWWEMIVWTVPSVKESSSKCKTCNFRSICTFALSDQCIACMSALSTKSCDSVGGQWMTWSDCVNVQADLGLFFSHIYRKH